MKVMIKDQSGLVKEIDAKYIEVDGKMLSTLFKEIKADIIDLKRYKSKLEKDHEEMIKIWKSLR